MGYDNRGHVDKYASRGCLSVSGLWAHAHSTSFQCIVRVIGEMLDFQPGHFILDWGGGCGHFLTMYAQFFGGIGFGVDITQGAINWAQSHAVGTFCHHDASNLTWVPSDTFDRVVSYAALYHLPKDVQCTVLMELVRVVRPGGAIWIGWNGAHEIVDPGWWNSVCFAKVPRSMALLKVVPERDLFVHPSFGHADVTYDFHELFFQFRSYSIFIHVFKEQVLYLRRSLGY